MKTHKNKSVVIGAGNVGEAIAYKLMVRFLANDMVLVDVNEDRARGAALDIAHGTSFFKQVWVRSGGYEECADAQMIIIAAGVARKPGQTRLDLAQINVDILKSIIPQITKYAPDATYIIVSNPVDILTYTFCKCSGLPEHQIMGSGTVLDTARLRYSLSDHFQVAQKNAHAYVYGEHGDSAFIPWSLATVTNNKIDDYKNHVTTTRPIQWEAGDHAVVEEFVKKSGAQVIKSKGATFYAVSASVCHICRSLMGGIDTPLTVSTITPSETSRFMPSGSK